MINKSKQKTVARAKRHNRLRHRVFGTATRPRLAVYKSNTAVYAQLIDDEAGKTIAASDTRAEEKGALLEKAKITGNAIAKKAIAAKVTEVVFDRGGFRYQGVIAALADGAREGGLKF